MNRTHILLKLIVLLGLLSVIVASASPTTAQEPPSEETTPRFDPRFGAVDSFTNTAEANEAGLGWTRVFFRWDVVQPAGSSDWKPTNVPDTFLNAEVEAGREVVAVLIGTPSWVTESRLSTAVPPQELWGDFVFKIATQYKGRIKHWVIWNQPDINDPTSPNYTWAGDVEAYYDLLREAYLKIKAVDPEMQIHVAGLTYTWDRDRGNQQYLERLLDVILADPQAANENFYFDTVSYHLYYDPRQILTVVGDVRRILESRGLGGKAVWINETNAPPSEDFLEPLQAPAAFNITLEEQSAFVVQAFALGLAGGADRIAFNKMRNDTLHPESVEPYGLLRGDNSRRPAFNALKTVTTYFAGTQSTAWQLSGNVYIVTLNREGQTTTVLWNLSTTALDFTMGAIAPQALLVDDQGNQQQIFSANGVYTVSLPGALCSNSSNCFIGGSPRLLIETGDPSQRAAAAPLPEASPTATIVTLPTVTPTHTPLLTVAPPPTITPTPDGNVVAPGVTVSPTAGPDPEISASAPSPAVAADISVAPAALPNPGTGQSDENLSSTQAPTIDTALIPPVTFQTVMTPRRILWLFIIGLVVFMVSYGVQVAIWYRVRR